MINAINLIWRYLVKVILIFVLGFTHVYALSITGTVIDATNQFPIDSAQVEIINENSGQRDTVYADVSGSWSYTFNPASVKERSNLPKQLLVNQNYPNPFNPSTLIRFSITEPAEVRIAVHNILGQEIDFRKKFLPPGNYNIHWKSRGSAGVYFYMVATKNATIIKKMIQLDRGYDGGLSDITNGASQTESEFYKNNAIPLTLVISKFGYVSDTLSVVVSGGEHFDASIETIHSRATMIDLHNDVLYKIAEDGDYHLGEWHNYNHTDIPRLRQGGVDIQFFVIWISPSSYPNNPYQRAMDYVRIMNTEFVLNIDDIQQALTLSGALAINADGKIAGIMAVEGGHAIQNNIDNLLNLYNAGMRYMTITWNNSTDWAVSAQDYRSETVGLSDFGKTVIKTLDSLGVIIDVSHTGIKTIKDILEITKNPIIASHSGVRALRNHYRNLYDDQIISIANTGGVIGVVFYPHFLAYSGTPVTINTVIAHIDYIVNLVGIDYVAIGSDFDGIEITPIGLEDTSKFPDLTLALLKHNYSRSDVEKILGGNFIRVFQEVCGNKLAANNVTYRH